MNKQRTTIFVLAVVFSMMLFSPVYAEGEAISADDFLMNQRAEAPASQLEEDTAKPKEMTEVEKGIAEAKEELKDEATLKRKLELAKRMHDIRPTRIQVDSAVFQASMSLPVRERRGFINSMKGMLNYNAIERISIDAMVEVYTLKELEAMVEYFSKPEAKSASDKVPNWVSILQPEIANMIDKAMIRIRTGQ